ncbi:MAG TPA: S8 family serine peptidase, partial [Sedimentisphaerales bacterium]|nr:S8 family serine peptidase [Sedimentisphaerales bacterium]
GDPEKKIKQAFGNDFQLEEFEGKDILTYEDKGLHFEIHKKDRTVMETNEPNTITIVPGLRVGDYTLGMSKDEVLKKLGEPKVILFEGERYTLNNLPRRYFMVFDGISFGIVDDSVKGIIVLSPLYKFTNGLGVGDSEQKIKQAFGDDFQLREMKGADFLAYEDEGLAFEIHKKNRTVMQINVSQTTGDRGDSDAPNSGKAIMLSEQSPGPITFPKIDRKPKPGRWGRGEMKSLPKYDPDSGNPFQVDLRGYDLSKLDLRNSIENLMYAAFDDRTIWPAPNQMPSDFNWQKFMELGKNPGLGIRSLHKKGITGRGVRVAIIDQPLLVDHQEYVERVRLYEEIDLQGETDPSMHGAAVASIAVGKTVGVAPEAELYYIAQWFYDKGTPSLRSLAQGIHRMLEINEQLPKDNKIRVISMSIGWMPSHKDYKVITEAVQKARAAGMLVVCSGVQSVHEGCGFGGLGRSPLADPEVFESYEPGLYLAKIFRARRIFLAKCHFWVPMDSRTTASPIGSDEYVFYSIGGVSWAIPYIAGVYALAVQVDPTITPERFWALAVQTGRTIELNDNGETMPLGPIIDPVRLIRSIKAGEFSNLIRKQSDNQRIRTHPQTNSETKTIVPGVRVGDYTFDMSKDEVLRKLGEPEYIHFGEDEVVHRGEEKYNLNNLPRGLIIMAFGNISFWISDDSVEAISVRSPLYKFSNGLGVGDSEQKIKQAFGEDFQLGEGKDLRLREDEEKDLLFYDAKGLGFEIHKKNQTIAEILVYEGSSVKPIESIKPFDDVRSKDLSKLDLSSSKGLIATLAFNQQTVWPEQAKMPPGSDPKKILADGMNPGLGVRELHQQGITGKGVNVAIIDQPLLPDHPEYDGKIVAYHDTGCGPSRSSMHGPAVASLLVGTNCGTAPDAKVYYAAAPMWTGDTAYEAKALDWIVEQNKKLPVTQKIRVVSVSAAPSSLRARVKNQHMWDPACARAEADGIMVLDGTNHRGFLSRCWYDVRDPESVGKCNPGVPEREYRLELLDPAYIHVPASCRTTAKSAGDYRDSYVYWGSGGESWTFPYCAGVLAMGWQIRPDLTPAQMKEMLFASAHVQKSGAKIINPRAFIDLVRKHSRDQQHIRTRPQTPSETQTIVPGVRVGDYTIGMSKDDVLKELGEPEAIHLGIGEEGEEEVIHRGEEKYSLNNLPRKYIMAFGNISFLIEEDSALAIFVRSPLYKLGNGFGVGDSEQRIKQAFGEDFQSREEEGKDYLCYDAKGLAFEIHKKNQTVAEIVTYQPKVDRPDSAQVALVRKAAAEGRILYKVTTPEEFKEIAGQPTREWTYGDDVIYMEYPGIEVKFVGKPESNTPHTIIYVLCERMGIDIGQDRPIDDGDLDQQPDRRSSQDLSTLVRQAATEGRILFKLTTPEEFKEIVGQPTREEVGNRPGTRVNLFYPGVSAKFFGWPDEPRTLGQVWCEGRQIDIGQNRPVVLRDEGDLSRFGKYNNICGADLSRLDLSQKGDLLKRMTFDSLTVWPEPGRLPRGFEPGRRIEEGKNPGLGVRSLHQEGINGSGVGIAIVDGILRRDHIEYADRIKSYHVREAEGGSHAPPVCSIAVGKTCGVAPGASLHFYGVLTGDNRRYARAVEQIVGRNRNLPPSEKVRVISISIGVSQKDHYDQWRAAADKAKKNGILVVTCDKQDFMPYGTLKRKVGKDPDDPNNYGPSYLSGDGNALVYVPIENRSTASHRGKDVYKFYTYGGNSWAAPYLAGLAALAFQVHPGISPDRIVDLWKETATRTKIGPVVNPRGFIEAVKRL